MLSNVEALEALAQAGTMGRAGRTLRITQSAVSKRIAALEAHFGVDLIERRGRHVVLTAQGERLIERLRPMLAELRFALKGEGEGRLAGVLTVGVSEAVLASWGAGMLRAAYAARPGLELRLHAHRSPVVEDRVAAGEYALGIVAGRCGDAALASVALASEPMVVIGGDARAALDVITIEERSGTWAALARRAARLGIRPRMRVESFFAAARMALEGFGPGLVPLGVCEALKVPRGRWRPLAGGLERPISLVARKTTLARPAVDELVEATRTACTQIEARWRRLVAEKD